MMPNDSNDTMRRKANAELALRCKKSAMAYFFLFPLCGISGGYYYQAPILTLFLTFLISALVLIRYYIIHQDPQLQIASSLRKTILYARLTGLSWGLFVASIFYFNGLQTKDMALWIATIAISSASVHTFAPQRNLAISYQLALLLPLILVASSPFSHSLLIALIFTVYTGYMLQTTKQVTQEYSQSLITQMELVDKNEQLASARDQAVEAMQVRSQFLANMSHEIRTPMNGIIGMLELLKTETLSPQQEKWVDTAARSGEVLLRLLNDVLDLSKLQANKLELESYPFNLQQLIHDIYELNLSNIQGKACELQLKLGDNLPEYVMGDYIRLWQVLNNLLTNAIKFTHHGHIILSVSQQSENTDTHTLAFCISDTGIGIAQELHEKIFEQFSQADQSTTRKYGGTGLGLNICKRIVEAMGSHIELQSQLGEGTQFSFVIVFQKASPTDSQHTYTQTSMVEPTPTAPILIVEDNKVNQMVLIGFMRKLNLTCDVANNGEEAIQMIQAKHYALIFMDIQMPVMDGFTAIQTIKNQQLTESPIIALTAHAMEEDRKKCLEQGFSAYLSKPVQFEILKLNVQQWLA